MQPEYAERQTIDFLAARRKPQPDYATIAAADAPVRSATASARRRAALSMRVISHSMRLLDWLLLVCVGWAIAQWTPYFGLEGAKADAIRLAIFGATLFVVVGETAGVYMLEQALDPGRCWRALVNAWSVAMLFVAAIFLEVTTWTEDRQHLLMLAASISFISLFASRALAMPIILRLRRDGLFNTRVALLGTADQTGALARYIVNNPSLNISVLGYFNDLTADDDESSSHADADGSPPAPLGGMAELMRAIRRGEIDKVIVAIPWTARVRLRACLNLLGTTPVEIQLAPEWAHEWAERPILLLGDLPILSLAEKPLSGWRLLFKALEDRVLALLALIVLAPIMILAAIAIKLDSPGPVFFHQLREGYNCKPFRIVKFRTMHAHVCGQAEVVQATRFDSRVTRVGALLRRTSIDELPQLFNVLNGSMSLVGPRPHAASTRAGGKLFAEIEASYARRHNVKPGMTGWAQVSGWRGETHSEEMLSKRLQHDLQYVEKCSIWFDLYILVRTSVMIFFQRSAY